jgi:hypothetical protein
VLADIINQSMKKNNRMMCRVRGTVTFLLLAVEELEEPAAFCGS